MTTPLLNLDEYLNNADWPKRTPDVDLPAPGKSMDDLVSRPRLADYYPELLSPLERWAQYERKYRPDQPRDAHGRWTQGMIAEGSFVNWLRGRPSDTLPLTANPLGASSVAELNIRMAKKYPHVAFDFQGATIENAREVAGALDDMAREYPEIAAKLRYVGTTLNGDKTPRPLRHYFDGKDLCTAVSHPDGYIAFNPKDMANPRINEVLAANEVPENNERVGWFPQHGGSLRMTAVHEFGHLVEFQLRWNTEKSPLDPKMTVADEYRSLVKGLRDDGERISGYARDGSQSGVLGEMFAEGFRALHCEPEAEIRDNKFLLAENYLLQKAAHGQVKYQQRGDG